MKAGARSATRDGHVLVCFAVKEEARTFQRTIAGTTQIETLITGMGRKNAERVIREALSHGKPTQVLSCGFAGGLYGQITSGTVIFDCDDASLESKLLKAGARRAKFHCAPRVAVTVSEKATLRQTTGADAVEMESEIIGIVCRAHGISFATVRVILDTADEDLPLDFNRLMTPDERMDYFKLAAAIVRSPGKIGALRKLQKQSDGAALALGKVLSAVLLG